MIHFILSDLSAKIDDVCDLGMIAADELTSIKNLTKSKPWLIGVNAALSVPFVMPRCHLPENPVLYPSSFMYLAIDF